MGVPNVTKYSLNDSANKNKLLAGFYIKCQLLTQEMLAFPDQVGGLQVFSGILPNSLTPLQNDAVFGKAHLTGGAHVVELESGEIVSVSLHHADQGDTKTVEQSLDDARVKRSALLDTVASGEARFIEGESPDAGVCRAGGAEFRALSLPWRYASSLASGS